MGGLGNQMFQFAAGRRLALRHGVPLRLDVGWFAEIDPRDTPRQYELGGFCGDADVIKEAVPLREGRWWRRRSRGVLRQTGNGFDARVLSAPDGAHLVGFWASERYFADVAATIRADFVPCNPLAARNADLAERIAADPAAVSLHVRRGDYLSNVHARDFHGVMDVDYYRRAVELVARTAGTSQLHLYAFSDDPDWCEASLDLGHPLTVVRGNDSAAIEDMMLMASCRHHVVANSTFSWWGAWLGTAVDAVVVAPDRWVKDPMVDTSAIYAQGWLRA
jgi:hypothetical protein